MTLLAGLVALILQAAPVSGPAALQFSLPDVVGVTADPTCGGRPGLNAIATCVATTQAGVEAAVDAFNADFETQGWLPADGSDNRIIYVKRRPDGGCDAFQLLAFAGAGAAVAPAAPAYLALAAIPGDICTTAPAASTAPGTPPTP